MSLFAHYLSLPYLLYGTWFTIEVTVFGLLGGTLLGSILGAMQLSRAALLAGFARSYAVIFRGTPLILQMVFAYDALPHIGLKLGAVTAASLAIAANEAPFIAEILRSGVRGVDPGQVMAGQALGMTPRVLMRRIIAPQAIRTMVPALGNECVSALKNSSLASVIAVPELTLRSTQLASSTFDFFSIFFASGVMYLVLTGLASALQLGIERLLDLDRVMKRKRPVASAPAVIAPITTSPDAARPRGEVVIEIKKLHKRYGEQIVLDHLDLVVRVGEIVALLGRSGSGKSTLLRCINQLERWDAGSVLVGGRQLGVAADGRTLSPREVAGARANLGVGIVFQQFNLFGHLTARQNVAGPLVWVHGVSPVEADRRAMALLGRVGLAHRADALPRHLSGGQQQRVAIARALAPNPSVLLLDEPTSALDPELVEEVMDVIRSLAAQEGLTMIISTHQLRFASKIATRVVFLADGVVKEDGPAREVLTAPSNPLTARFLRVIGADSAAPVGV
ncbi:amino acid ABC transporter permease/ATP-binding protein [Rhodopila sp.]|uniref:amino acid ABC transporter permease/ATP-binding protein n=1 Tax=Rhodopila sp. TaxID=2480087 RepID=UPI003D115D73